MTEPANRPWNQSTPPILIQRTGKGKLSSGEKIVAGIGGAIFLVAVASDWHLLYLVPIVIGVVLFVRQRAEDQRQRAAIYAARAREIASYHGMNAREFEHAIAYLCQRDGCTNVRVVGGAGDLGADVIATSPEGHRIVIQCKRYAYSNKVGSPDMQRFGGTCYSVHGAQVAALVTTSTFTRQAADYGYGQGIRLWDNDMLAGWASQTGPAPWH